MSGRIPGCRVTAAAGFAAPPLLCACVCTRWGGGRVHFPAPPLAGEAGTCWAGSGDEVLSDAGRSPAALRCRAAGLAAGRRFGGGKVRPFPPPRPAPLPARSGPARPGPPRGSWGPAGPGLLGAVHRRGARPAPARAAGEAAPLLPATGCRLSLSSAPAEHLSARGA